MIYKLEVTQRAKQDRDRAFDWYSENYSKEFAVRWYDLITRAVESLAYDPMRCHKARERVAFRLSFTNYFVAGERTNIASCSR